MKRNSKSANLRNNVASDTLYEAETTIGLEFVTAQELRDVGADVLYQGRGEVGFRYAGDVRQLLALKTVQAIYLRRSFGVPRPKALLGNTNFPVILAQIEQVRQLSNPRDFQTLYLAAAGSDSSVMIRIKQELAQATGLSIAGDKGDLWLRIRPGREGGWETLVRLTSRPSVTREWRVCNFEGALNAATAQAMIRLTEPHPDDIFVNLGCGSGTLLIERLAYGSVRVALGVDHDRTALDCAVSNIAASGYAHRVHLQRADISRLPLADHSASVLCADLPFGQLSGSHQANVKLYPRMLDEAARIAEPDARFVLITHEVKLIEQLLARHRQWKTINVYPVNLRGLHPRIYVLQRV